MGQFFQQENACPLAHDEAAALRIKGDGGPVGVLRLGQGLHGGEAADGHGRDGGLGAAAEHDLGVAVPNVVERVACCRRWGAGNTLPLPCYFVFHYDYTACL